MACAYAAGSILAVSQDSRLDPAIGGCRRNHGETPSSTGLVQEHSVGADLIATTVLWLVGAAAALLIFSETASPYYQQEPA